VTKEFQAKVLVSARPDGTVIVHNLGNGVRPLCYIDGGAEISIARNLADVEIEFFATTEDGQQLTLQFTEITAMQGVPSSKQSNSMAMSILKCVFDLGGNYGRTTIARILTGSVSKKILTINISKLETYGMAKDTSMKEVLSLVDWLIQENYLAYVEDSDFPVLVVTSKGLDVLGREHANTEYDTDEMKEDWLREHGYPSLSIESNCTLCHYYRNDTIKCPLGMPKTEATCDRGCIHNYGYRNSMTGLQIIKFNRKIQELVK
jgi:hypothetical protein